MLLEPQRQRVVRELADRLEHDVGAIGPILCAIRPWTTGDDARDDALQAVAFRLMQAETSAESADFRWLDCMASNREGYYRAAALDPMFNIRQAYCAGQAGKPAYTPDLAETIDRLRVFDGRMASGLAAAHAPGTVEKFSYYPLRNAIRIANLRAARAVSLREASPEAAMEQLRVAADELDGMLAALDPVNTRNGWRLYNDVAFHAALYRWLADGGDQGAIKAFLDPLPVRRDAALRPALTPEVLSEMPEGFVDPIYVDRLLPGAQGDNGERECAAWHQRSYAPEELAAAVLACSDRDLKTFDDCLVGFEARDWTVVFSTLPRLESERRQQRLLRESQEFLDEARSRDVTGEAEEAFDAMGALVLDTGGGVAQVRARGTISTSHREELLKLFEATRKFGIKPLFQRPRTY